LLEYVASRRAFSGTYDDKEDYLLPILRAGLIQFDYREEVVSTRDTEWDEVDRRFLASEPIEGVVFLLNDSVEVITGPHCGARGAVVGLDALTPEPIYVVELGNGQDVHLKESEIAARES
jgi:hypothetical protein